MNDFLNHFKNNKRDLINLIFLIILVISLPFAFKLAKERQLFSPKASNNAIDVVMPTTGSDIQRIDDQTIKTSNPNIQLNITSPLEEGGQSFNPFNLIGTVYAAPGDEYDLGELLTSPPIDPDAGNCSVDKTTLLVTNNATKNVNCTDKSKTKNKDAVCDFKNNVFGCYEKLPKAAAPAAKLQNKSPQDGISKTLKTDSDFIEFTWDGGDPKIKWYEFQIYRGTKNNPIAGKRIDEGNPNPCGPVGADGTAQNKALNYCTITTNKSIRVIKKYFDKGEGVYTWVVVGRDESSMTMGNYYKITVKVEDSAAPAASATGICKNDTDCVDGNACTQDICINKKCAHNDVGMGSACAFESTPPYSKAVKWCNADAECKLTTDPSGTGAGSDSGAKNAGGSTPQTAEAISIACRNRTVNDPDWCLGYPIQCEGTGVTWYYGGKKVKDANGNTKCEYNNSWACGAFRLNTDGSPASTLGCTKPWPPAPGASGAQQAAGAGTPSKPGGQGGAPARPAPGEGDSDKVTLCGTEMSMAQARSAVGLSGGNRATVSDNYLKKFCPGSQNNCSLEPGFPEILEATPKVGNTEYVWVANCNRACLRNNSTGNDKDLLVDPNPNDLAACPKNYNDFSVDPKTSNWCYGFAGTGENTNRCMVLWTKAKYAELKAAGKSPFDLGSGTPGANAGGGTTPAASNGWTEATSTCANNTFTGCALPGKDPCTDWGQGAGAVGAPYVAAGWTQAKFTRCQTACTAYGAAKDNAKACAAVGVTVTPVGGNANWVKASCSTDIKFAGCTLTGGTVCSDTGLVQTGSTWGLRTGVVKADADLCSAACAKYGTAKNDVEACKAIGVVAPPAGDAAKQTISGIITYTSCNNVPAAGVTVEVLNLTANQSKTFRTTNDGKFSFNDLVNKGDLYAVTTRNTPIVNTNVETLTQRATYNNQQEGKAGENCSDKCDFHLTADCTKISSVQARVAQTTTTTTTQYLLTENRNDFTNLAVQWTNYPAGGIKNFPYTINGVGQHTLFLKFKDDQGNIIDNNGTPYTFYVELLAPAAGSPVQPRVISPDAAPTCTTTDRSCCGATPVACASQSECSGKYNWCYAGVCIDGNYKENDSNPGKGLGTCTVQTPPAGGGDSGEPASCKTTTVCGQTVTGNSPADCKPECSGGNATYACTQSDNSNCQGTVLCASENARCNGGAQATACAATETVCGQSVYDHYTLRCSNGQAFYDSYQTNNPGNCTGTIQCETDNYKCEGI